METENLNWNQELVSKLYNGSINMWDCYAGLQAQIKKETPKHYLFGAIHTVWF